jgi:hypothetical protein
VFAKPPIPGLVKTRLAAAVGGRCAADLALALFQDTWAMVATLPWARPILATTSTDTRPFGVAEPIETWPQGEGDLGERMERVLARAVAEAGRAIVIGSDLPGLPAGHLDAARLALARADAVIGPADDGGFYLLGLRRVPEGLLEGLAWSHPETRVATERRLEARGFAIARLAPWFDLDLPGDLAPARRALETAPTMAPRTLAALRSIKDHECDCP